MKRTISALALCIALLSAASYILIPVRAAGEDVIDVLLALPAPPPPNPLNARRARRRDEKFFDKTTPPRDDAPIEDLTDYWTRQAADFRRLGYNPAPSERTVQRLLGAIESEPASVKRYLSVLPPSESTASALANLLERGTESGELDRDTRSDVREWLAYNSKQYSGEIQAKSLQVADANEYVTNQRELLALTDVDFEGARPIIDRLYGDPNQKVSQVLAKWALYKHGLNTGSSGDVDRYRDELKAVVEDRNSSAGMRDLALDALLKEKDWPGRDDWYFSLMSDETLGDLRVNGQSYTGLTTIMFYAPPEKYAGKMIELSANTDPVVRGAAARNLLVILNEKDPAVVKALLPWLEDPKWSKQTGNERESIVAALQSVRVPESVPALIAALDERGTRTVTIGDAYSGPYGGTNTNRAYAANVRLMNSEARADGAVSAGGTSNTAAVRQAVRTEAYYPLRAAAVGALAMQKDARAVPALRRILAATKGYERVQVVQGLLACGGFTVQEQAEAVESVARSTVPLVPYAVGNMTYGQLTGGLDPYETNTIIGNQLSAESEVSDELAAAVYARVKELDRIEPQVSSALRKFLLAWKGLTVDRMMLGDIRDGKADADQVLRALATRKMLREKLPAELSSLRTGTPAARAFSACILEDKNDYDAILAGGSAEAKAALFACARLVRAPLPVQKAAENLGSKDKRLADAAESFLISEDSRAARAIVLGRHPGEAKILGATTAFYSGKQQEPRWRSASFLASLFADAEGGAMFGDVFQPFAGNSGPAKTDAKLKSLFDEDAELQAVYDLGIESVRVYKDRALFVRQSDPARYSERVLRPDEIERLRSYLAAQDADDLKPFLGCFSGCINMELITATRNGGRRVYAQYDRLPEFFAGLEKIFADIASEPTTIKYELSKTVPGLEVIFANDDLDAVTVWKGGGELKLLLKSKRIRQKVDDEAADAEEESYRTGGVEAGEKAEQMRADRQFEGYGWYRLSNGQFEISTQPDGVEVIPPRDELSVQPGSERWKARAGSVEVRADSTGLYKVSGGRMTKLAAAGYDYPVISADGKWAIAMRSTDGDGETMVRIDLVSGKEYKAESDLSPAPSPEVFIPALNKFLIGSDYDGGEYETDADNVLPHSLLLMDAATGRMVPAAGEFRPAVQQTFRPLQPAGKADEFWAAIPDKQKNETVIGKYDAKLAKFTSVMAVPKIRFDSMDMWVDEPGGEIYFVYAGQLMGLKMPPAAAR